MKWLLSITLVACASAFAPPQSIRPSSAGFSSTSLNVFDVGVAQTVASAAAIPAVFVGTGSFLLNGEDEEELEFEANTESGEEVDIYRDTPLRYCGYANEVGEAFAPLVPAWCVPASYAVAITYVLADTLDKTFKALNGDKYTPSANLKCALIEGLDALIWQLAASVALPGYTIHQVVAIAVTVLNAAGLTADQNPIYGVIPTALGLATIPLIVKPLDELAEVSMDLTLRKVWGPYLESCELVFDEPEQKKGGLFAKFF
jgi:mitochondrial fission process protein 1